MKLNPQDLEKIADRTLEHYNEGAEDFWEGTRNHDVSQNIEALLQYIEGDMPFATLKPRGVFTSKPHGLNEEGWNCGLYGA